MNETIHEINEAAKASGLSYGQYVNQTEAPAPPRQEEDQYEAWKRICPVCGQTFVTKTEKSRQVYCGPACRTMANNRKRDGQTAEKKDEVALLQAENAALRTDLMVNRKTPDQQAKADAGKPKLSLVPTRIIFDIARIREYGTRKYGDPDNWKAVEPQRYLDAAFRHLLDYIANPSGTDEESGLPHLWNLACNVAFLCELEDKQWQEE